MTLQGPPRTLDIRSVRRQERVRTAAEKSDTAVLVLMTRARDRATASIKLKHVDMDKRRIIQDATQVNAKFSKTFTTWLTIAVWRTSLDVIGSHARFSTTELLALTYTDPVLD